MSGWSILITTMVCLSGVLLFLRLVASALQYADAVLLAFERHKVKMYRRRQEAAQRLKRNDTFVAERAAKTA